MTYVIDSDLVISLLRGSVSSRLVDWIDGRRERIAVSVVSVMELRFGADRARQPELEHLAVDEMLATLTVADFDRNAADHAGAIRAELRKAGTSIGPYDVLIAGHARSLAATLVTGNIAEFSRVPGLLVEDWRAIA